MMHIPEDIRSMVNEYVKGACNRLEEAELAALLEAADSGDLPAIHDLLVKHMLAHRGISYVASVLREVDQNCEESAAPVGRLP